MSACFINCLCCLSDLEPDFVIELKTFVESLFADDFTLKKVNGNYITFENMLLLIIVRINMNLNTKINLINSFIIFKELF